MAKHLETLHYYQILVSLVKTCSSCDAAGDEQSGAGKPEKGVELRK